MVRKPLLAGLPVEAATRFRFRKRWATRAGCMVWVGLVLGILAGPLVHAPLAAQAPASEEGATATPLEAVVTRIVEAGMAEMMGTMYAYQILEMRLLRPPDGVPERLQVRNSMAQGGVVGALKVGDRVWLQPEVNPEGQRDYLVVARSRGRELAWALAAFIAVVVLVSQWHGVRALLGLGLSFLVVFAFIIPRIAAGGSPVGVTLLGLGVTMPVSYYLAHGLNRKTTVALLGSLLAMGFTGLLAQQMASATHLTGLASEEAAFVLGVYGRQIDVKALLLAGILISILGVLDDITVAQAAVVEQLVEASPEWQSEALVVRAMAVGRDHIASMVNTLVLVYAGSALPLLLLLTNRSLPLGYTVSFELVTEEIVRMLVTSIGLVAAVPVTTFLAAQTMGGRRRRERGQPEPPPYA